MTMTLVQRAEYLARRAHAGQKRKYDGRPYIVHPEKVATEVAKLPGVTDIEIAAAWLHDVIEDCDEWFAKEIRLEFPPEVEILVCELTNPSKDSKAPRWVRKTLNRNHSRNASLWARKIKLIDRICNLHDMSHDNAPLDFRLLYCNESEQLAVALHGTDEELEHRLVEEITRLRLKKVDVEAPTKRCVDAAQEA